ncbi:hypothetical protein GCM10022222_68720 [Amycolatopsis ultiminotia]|uniref:Uncharacterized protein n=1 Tax=Amycolatopsis ultiminotia TaxID=543629 RepID=A0ABP6XZZ3_9PSEU
MPRPDLPTGRPECLAGPPNVLVKAGFVPNGAPAPAPHPRPGTTDQLVCRAAVPQPLTERDVRVVSPAVDSPAGPHFAERSPVTLRYRPRHFPDHRHTAAETTRARQRTGCAG